MTFRQFDCSVGISPLGHVEFDFCVKAEVELVKQDAHGEVVNAIVVLLRKDLVVRNVLIFVIIELCCVLLCAYFSAPSEADEHYLVARLVVHDLPGHNLSVCDPLNFASLAVESV